MFFIWDDWNFDHLEKHQVEPLEAEYVARYPKKPYPRSIGSGKWLVRGRTLGNRQLQVIYVKKNADEIEFSLLTKLEQVELLEGEAAVYVIHARDLRRGEK